MRIANILFALGLAAGTMFLSGCNNDNTQPEPKPPVQQKPVTHEKVELIEEGRPEASIRHVYDELDREIQRDVNYRNGDAETAKFREDGTTSEYVRKNKAGKIKARKVFAADGKTVVEGEATRTDGTTLWVADKTATGASRKVTYWYDGKRVFSEEIRQADGSFEVTYYRKSGSISGKKRGKGSTVSAEDFFDASGQQTYRIEPRPNGRKAVTRYRNGSAYMRQTVVETPNSWGGSSQTVEVVEELDSTGKVTRRIVGESSYSIKSTETFNADGSRIVRTMRSDGTIGKEVTYDAGGKEVSAKEYKDDERVRETVDWDLFWRPSTPDLEGGWKNQEDSPWSRDWRDE